MKCNSLQRSTPLLFALISFHLMNAAVAAPMVYSGYDEGADASDPRPNSSAAAAAFNGSTPANHYRGVDALDFAAVGAFDQLVRGVNSTPYTGNGVLCVITGRDIAGQKQSLRNAPINTPEEQFGYNTTPSGDRFISVNGGSVTFSFARPIDAFGVYLTGLQGGAGGEGTITMTYGSGPSQTISFPTAASSGGIAFIGFRDVDNHFTRVTINAGNASADIMAVDDIRIEWPVPTYTTFTYTGFFTDGQEHHPSGFPVTIGARFTAHLTLINNTVPPGGGPEDEYARFGAQDLGRLKIECGTFSNTVSEHFFQLETRKAAVGGSTAAFGEGYNSFFNTLRFTDLNGSIVQSSAWNLAQYSSPAWSRINLEGSVPNGSTEYRYKGVVASTAAFSRKHHNPGPMVDAFLPNDGSLGTECRTGGPNGDFSIVVLFDRDVATAQASFTQGTGAISGAPIVSGSSVTVNLTGVSDAQVIALRLTGLTDTSGQALPDRDMQMRILLGDVNGDGIVNAGDALRVRKATGSPLHQHENINARSDVNCDGAINSGDALIVRARSGTSPN